MNQYFFFSVYHLISFFSLTFCLLLFRLFNITNCILSLIHQTGAFFLHRIYLFFHLFIYLSNFFLSFFLSFILNLSNFYFLFLSHFSFYHSIFLLFFLNLSNIYLLPFISFVPFILYSSSNLFSFLFLLIYPNL